MSETDRTIIEVQDVTRTYNQGAVQVHALRGIDLRIRQGEFSALAGPSGSGKTTLLNLIGCLDHPTGGHILIDGKPVTRLDRHAAALYRLARIGFVFQAYNLIPVLTAYENAEFILLLQGVAKEERKKLVVPLLERVGLAHEMNRKPHELSGGQQQRVAIVRAIASRPSIVLADEPTANLDAETGAELIDLMQQLNRENRITFLFATHDTLVMKRARRLIRLRSGRIHSDEVQEP
ncbi:MAG: ABC transporter ATP-binding protein [Bradymonadales bacterium]|nr:ABC transporter ATP-binding protein [Bradymonadales bacterium]